MLTPCQCKSWFKRGSSEGRIVALFPGSSLALRELLSHPRWEDFEFTPRQDSAENCFSWIGNGMTVGEILQTDTVPYLKDVEVISPAVVKVDSQNGAHTPPKTPDTKAVPMSDGTSVHVSDGQA